MAARQKLNSIFAGGLLGVAMFIGVAFQSWIAFVLASVVLVALANHAGVLRFSGNDR